MDFNTQLFNFVFSEKFSEKVLNDCFLLICETENKYNGFTVPQVICIRAYLKTMRKRVLNENKSLIHTFDDLFSGIINYNF